MSNAEWPTEVSTEGESDNRGFDFGQALLHRKWMLLFFLALGAAAGSFIHSRTEPVYTSFARLLIKQNQQSLVDGASRLSQKNPLDTYAVLICSPTIVQKAVELRNLSQLPSLKGSNRVSVIIQGLTAEPHEDSTDYLQLSYSGKNQGDTQTILSAVIAAFIKHLEDSRNESTGIDVGIITDAKDKLHAQLEEDERKYQEFREEAEAEGMIWTQEGGLNIHQQRLADIETKRSALLIEQSDTQTQLDSIQEALSRGAKREALLLMVDQLDRSQDTPVGAEPPPTSFISHLLPLLTEKQLLVEKVGSRHPDVLALESRINLTRELLQEQSGVTVSGEPLDLLAVYIESLREKMSTLRKNLAGMDDLFKKESVANGLISSMENQDRAHREKIDITKSMFVSYVEMLQKLDVAKQVGPVSAEATTPPGMGVQTAPVLVRSLALGGVGGLLIGIVLAFLLEMADQSYRSPDDISRQLGVPVVGHIPNIEIGRERKRLGATRLHPSLVTYHRPGSQMAEAYRNVRTALLSGTRNQLHQLIQITSPNPGDGKSTLSTNLAMSIAKAGKSVLLIDADLRRPNIHTLLGMDSDVGVTSVVEGGVDFDDAIQAGPLPHLDVMTAGPRESNRAELLLSPRFAEMLNVLRERYDYVIVDTPPLLAVSDPAAIGAMVDGVILVLRINRQARLHAVRARETLDLVGARLIGVVVNALGDSTAVQGFGTGTRGYRAATYRTLAHGYADSYSGDARFGANGYASYYQETDEPEPLNGHHDFAGSRTEQDR